MEDLLATINRALRSRGWSVRQASIAAVGSHEFIRDMRRGRMPSVERLQALCDVLDLEFYVGPRRETGTIDEQRLEDAVASTERTLNIHAIALETRAKARAIIAVYELLDRERAPATAVRVRRLIEALSTPKSGGA